MFAFALFMLYLYQQILILLYILGKDVLSVFKSLSDATRLRILAILSKGDFNVNELIEIMQMGQSRISRHLKILADSGLVRSRREGNWIYYAMTQPEPRTDLFQAIQLAVNAAGSLENHEDDLQQLESIVQHRRALSKKYFERVGSNWERLQQDVLDSTYYRQHVLSYLPEKNQSIIDLGAGSGLFLPELLKRFESVTAIDSSPTMLKVAADYVAQQMPDARKRCDFRLGELEHIPISNNNVDTAVACMVLHHISHPIDAITEVYRILKPGGTFLIADLLQHDIVEMRDKYADLWLGFKPDDLNNWLHSAGFIIEKSDILTKNETIKVLIFQVTKER